MVACVVHYCCVVPQPLTQIAADATSGLLIESLLCGEGGKKENPIFCNKVRGKPWAFGWFYLVRKPITTPLLKDYVWCPRCHSLDTAKIE